VACR